MSYTDIPELIADYLPIAWVNGNYSWHYINSSYYTYILIYNLDFTTEQIVQVDQMIDDGNITYGNLRVALGGSGLFYLLRLEDPS